MRPTTLGFLVALASAAVVSGQPLSCPPAAGKCAGFHFHRSAFRPDSRTFVELRSGDDVPSSAMCDQARNAAIERNGAIVNYFRNVKNDDRYQPDVFGPCHCDMTWEPSSTTYLTDTQRLSEERLAAEVRSRVYERLLNSGLATDNDLVRSAVSTPPAAAVLGGPKLVTLPPAQPTVATVGIATDLKMTRVEPAAPTAANLDLPLVEIPLPGVAATPPTAAAETLPQPVQTAPATPAADPAPQPKTADATTPAAPAKPKEPEIQTQVVTADPPPPEPDAADLFITLETQRIQNVLAASNGITDESMKSKVLEACMQRVQLLSNLRSLIEGSGAKSRFAAAARAAREEPARLALVAKLFGRDMTSHWAAKDASDVVVDLGVDPITAEKTLSDNGASADDKRHALYVLLAHTQPTEEQQLWLTSVIDSLLQ